MAVLPVGSFEQHGDYLPLATDTIVSCLIAQRIAEDYRLLLLPPVTISFSHEHASFPGTVSVSAATLSAIIGDVRESLHARGIGTLVVVNGHGGNYVLSHVVLQANVTRRCVTLFPVREDWDRARQDAGCASSTSEDMHAGELETSLLLHADPALVRDGNASSDHLASPRPFLLVAGWAATPAAESSGCHRTEPPPRARPSSIASPGPSPPTSTSSPRRLRDHRARLAGHPADRAPRARCDAVSLESGRSTTMDVRRAAVAALRRPSTPFRWPSAVKPAVRRDLVARDTCAVLLSPGRRRDAGHSAVRGSPGRSRLELRKMTQRPQGCP